VTQKVGRGIAILFHDCGTRRASRPGRSLSLGKTRFPFYRWLGGTQGRSGREENLVPTGIRSRTYINILLFSLVRREAFHETLREFCSAVLEKVGEDQLDRSCEGWCVLRRVKHERNVLQTVNRRNDIDPDRSHFFCRSLIQQNLTVVDKNY